MSSSIEKICAFIRKARATGLSAANILAWLCLKLPMALGLFWGTACLRFKARLFGVKIGPRARAHGPVALLRWPGGEIEIGADVSFISSWRRATAASLAFPVRLRVFGKGAKIILGPGCQLSGTSITARSTVIELGRQVLVGPNCVITDSDFHQHWPAEQRANSPGYEKDQPVYIDDYAWIGMGSIILKGVHIGSGAIIGAGSVVTGDIPANCVACGAPAKVVRQAPETCVSAAKDEKAH